MRRGRSSCRLFRQALSFFVHTALALGSWLAFMLVGYLLNPPAIPQSLILLLSLHCRSSSASSSPVPPGQYGHLGLVAGPDLVLIVACGFLTCPQARMSVSNAAAAEKLTRTFFSLLRGPAELQKSTTMGPSLAPGRQPPLSATRLARGSCDAGERTDRRTAISSLCTQTNSDLILLSASCGIAGMRPVRRVREANPATPVR